MTLMDQGLQKTLGSSGKTMNEIYVRGLGAARAAVMSTKSIKDYEERSHCMLTPRKKTPIRDGFIEKPTCGQSDCANRALNVEHFDKKTKDGLSKCPGDDGAQKMEAFGSALWPLCGTRFAGTTRTCKLGSRTVCCCKDNRLSGSPEGVEKHQGCTQQCTSSLATKQRTLSHRMNMVAEETFGPKCNYGETLMHFNVASRLRATQQKLMYKLASGEQVGLGDMKKEQDDAINGAANSLVQLEEEHGSLLELDTESVALIVVCVIVLVALIILCIASADLCIILLLLAIIAN